MSKFCCVSLVLGVWGEYENLYGVDGLFLFFGIEELLVYGKIILFFKFMFMWYSMFMSLFCFEFGENFIMLLIFEKNIFL